MHDLASAPYGNGGGSPIIKILTRLTAVAAAIGIYALLGWITDSVIPRVVVAAVIFPLFLAILSGMGSWGSPRRA